VTAGINVSKIIIYYDVTRSCRSVVCRVFRLGRIRCLTTPTQNRNKIIFAYRVSQRARVTKTVHVLTGVVFPGLCKVMESPRFGRRTCVHGSRGVQTARRGGVGVTTNDENVFVRQRRRSRREIVFFNGPGSRRRRRNAKGRRTEEPRDGFDDDRKTAKVFWVAGAYART